MRTDWLSDVLRDILVFSEKNGLCGTAEHLRTTLTVLDREVKSGDKSGADKNLPKG